MTGARATSAIAAPMGGLGIAVSVLALGTLLGVAPSWHAVDGFVLAAIGATALTALLTSASLSEASDRKRGGLPLAVLALVVPIALASVGLLRTLHALSNDIESWGPTATVATKLSAIGGLARVRFVLAALLLGSSLGAAVGLFLGAPRTGRAAATVLVSIAGLGGIWLAEATVLVQAASAERVFHPDDAHLVMFLPALGRAARISHTLASARDAAYALMSIACLVTAGSALRRRGADRALLVSVLVVCAIVVLGEHATRIAALTRLRRPAHTTEPGFVALTDDGDEPSVGGATCVAGIAHFGCEGFAKVPYDLDSMTRSLPTPRPDECVSWLSVSIDARLGATPVRMLLRAAASRGYGALAVHGTLMPEGISRAAPTGWLGLVLPLPRRRHVYLRTNPPCQGIRVTEHARVRERDTAATLFARFARRPRPPYPGISVVPP
jgi:hypothetical protein